jgi:hypothetical protein
VLVGCGPSSKEVATAKSAQYKGDKLAIFADVKAVTEAKYKLTKSDETTLGMQTEARWFSPEGLSQTPRAEGDMRDVADKSIHIALVVKMVPVGDAWVVNIEPILERYNQGIPKPEPVKQGDASLPGWVDGKVDELAVEIHKALAKYEVKTVPQMVPPPTAPAPAPDEPSAGSPAAPATEPAPEAGSAAGSATN